MENIDRRYARIVYWSDLDQAYLVEVPDLPGCMADGETAVEAVAASDRIIREWLEVNEERGFPVPEPTFHKIDQYEEVKSALREAERIASDPGVRAYTVDEAFEELKNDERKV